MVLRDVHADMSGYYKCEVTTQELYDTVQEKHYLQVVRKFEKNIFHLLVKYFQQSCVSTRVVSIPLPILTSQGHMFTCQARLVPVPVCQLHLAISPRTLTITIYPQKYFRVCSENILFQHIFKCQDNDLLLAAN